MVRKCKIFRHKNWTPNDYNLNFNPSEIPSNIKRETVPELIKRLQKLVPLSKKIHLQLNNTPASRDEKNKLEINTSLKINNKEVKFE